MASEASDSKTKPTETQSSSSSSANGNGDAGEFECNICFELAQDPVITLCGHLFCWPCLYRWLRLHSHSHECPVCKALIQEEKLIPLYGRGKNQTDPRSKPVPGVEIPNRPAGQRPATAPPPEASAVPNFGFGLGGGFLPVMIGGFGNLGLLAGFCGFLPSMLSIQINNFADARPTYGTTSGYARGFSGGYHDRDFPRASETNQGAQAEDNRLVLILLIVMFLVIFSCMW
ncbi:hypothetical protein M9H77_15686 [Catharanthus roseus]|uniref:Uncharacterized protein n=1 Tax=Catharanthus roseus TaxID=4058 RepID=A0ACC0AXW1_CATRO|nr:hypothetical protein M9H77_15686 [Catharanthus roseus]